MHGILGNDGILGMMRRDRLMDGMANVLQANDLFQILCMSVAGGWLASELEMGEKVDYNLFVQTMPACMLSAVAIHSKLQ